MELQRAIDRLETIVNTVDADETPVPITEVWVFGDVALGLDPVSRVDVYVTKELLLGRNQTDDSDLEDEFGVKGIGTVIREPWARAHPDLVRTNPNGYVAPEKCLAAQLAPAEEPIHLEVCNVGFENNINQRIMGAIERESYENLLDPRAVCLWKDGQTSESAFEQLRAGEYVFPTLQESLEMVGLEEDTADIAASTFSEWHEDLEGRTIRGDIV